MQPHPILADLIASGYDVHVDHDAGLTRVRVVESKTSRTFSARADNEFMAALFAKGRVDLGLSDDPPLRAAA